MSRRGLSEAQRKRIAEMVEVNERESDKFEVPAPPVAYSEQQRWRRMAQTVPAAILGDPSNLDSGDVHRFINALYESTGRRPERYVTGMPPPPLKSQSLPAHWPEWLSDPIIEQIWGPWCPS